MKKSTFFIGILVLIIQSQCAVQKEDNDPGGTGDALVLAADIQAAVDNAVSGDIIAIGAGMARWTETVIIPDDKTLIIQGAGMNSTIIASNIAGAVFNLGFSDSRISGIGFDLENNDGVGIIARGSYWRIDNCRFNNDTDNTIEGVQVMGTNSQPHPVGVVDHCEFNNTRVLVLGDLSLMAHKIWAEPLGLGTNNAVFVEDCIFTRDHGNAIDSNYGGRYVFRYNIVNDASIECHSVQGNNRASRSWEIYNNTINQVTISIWAPFFLRGGTGVIFNNTITGNWSRLNIVVDNVRSCSDVGDGGLSDGTSSWDGNQSGLSGYPARDQIGRSTDDWEWTAENPYPTQTLDPVYAWNNKYGTTEVEFYVHGCDQNRIHIVENRDFYNNTQRPGYTPYTYPHPLTLE